MGILKWIIYEAGGVSGEIKVSEKRVTNEFNKFREELNPCLQKMQTDIENRAMRKEIESLVSEIVEKTFQNWGKNIDPISEAEKAKIAEAMEQKFEKSFSEYKAATSKKIAEEAQKLASEMVEKKIRELTEQNSKTIEQLQNLNSNLTAENNELKKSNATLQQNAATLNNQIIALSQQIEFLNKERGEQQKKISSIENKLQTPGVSNSKLEEIGEKVKKSEDKTNQLKTEIDKINKEIENIKNGKESTPSPEREPKESPKPSTPPTNIEKAQMFILSEQKAFFTGDSKDKQKLEECLKLENLIKTLQKAGLPQEKIESYLRIVDGHKESLEKFLAKVDLNEFSPDERSKKLTDKYFEIFKGDFLGNFMSALYRGLETNNMQNIGSLYKIIRAANAYLSNCGIYTRELLPGKKAEDDDYEDMEVQVRNVQDPNEDETILAIKRPVYRMKYKKSNGKESFTQFRGKMTIGSC